VKARRRRAASEVDGAPGWRRMPGERAARRASSRPAAWRGRPGSPRRGARRRVGPPMAASARRNARRRAGSTSCQSAGPGERLLDVRLGVADEMVRSGNAPGGHVAGAPPSGRRGIVAIVEPTSRRSQRLASRRAARARPSGTARRGSRGATRASASTVIQSRPRAPRAQQLPEFAPDRRDRSVEEVEREPAELRLELPEQAVRESSSECLTNRACRGTELPRVTAFRSGQADADHGPIPGATRCWPSRRSPGRRARRTRAEGGSTNASGRRSGSARRSVRGLGRGRPLGDERLARGRRRAPSASRRAEPRSSGSPGPGRSGFAVAVASLRSSALRASVAPTYVASSRQDLARASDVKVLHLAGLGLDEVLARAPPSRP
jgi:hypothetical protein